MNRIKNTLSGFFIGGVMGLPIALVIVNFLLQRANNLSDSEVPAYLARVGGSGEMIVLGSIIICGIIGAIIGYNRVSNGET